MKRILKRSFVFIITLVLVFSISVPCFASDTSSGATGWNSWSFKEKTDYCCKVGVDIIASVTGIVHGDTSSYKEYLLDLYAKNPAAGVDNFYEYLANGLSFDDDTQTWELSDDLVDFCNTVVVDYNDRVTMTYRYPVQVQSISADNFPNKTIYQALVDLCLAYPDCYVFTTNEYKGNHRGEAYMDLNGNAKELPYDSTSDNFYLFNVIPAPFAGVTQYMDMYSASTTYYNDNWEKSFTPKNFWFTSDGRVFTYCNESLKVGSTNYSAYYKQIEPGTYPDLSELGSMYYWSWYGTSYAMFLDNKHGASLSARTVYSANVGALNVYKSEADMKKDIGSQFIGSYADTYTGTPLQTITQSEINNIVNNYYPSDDDGGGSGGGGGSGSDDDGGGSGSGVFDDIISGIASGVGSIIKGIFSIIKELVDAIADAIGSIVGSITDLMSLLNGNFTEFLSAVFPFMPSEFVTILVASVTLCMLGVIIKIFKG